MRNISTGLLVLLLAGAALLLWRAFFWVDRQKLAKAITAKRNENIKVVELEEKRRAVDVLTRQAMRLDDLGARLRRAQASLKGSVAHLEHDADSLRQADMESLLCTRLVIDKKDLEILFYDWVSGRTAFSGEQGVNKEKCAERLQEIIDRLRETLGGTFTKPFDQAIVARVSQAIALDMVGDEYPSGGLMGVLSAKYRDDIQSQRNILANTLDRSEVSVAVIPEISERVAPIGVVEHPADFPDWAKEQLRLGRASTAERTSLRGIHSGQDTIFIIRGYPLVSINSLAFMAQNKGDRMQPHSCYLEYSKSIRAWMLEPLRLTLPITDDQAKQCLAMGFAKKSVRLRDGKIQLRIPEGGIWLTFSDMQCAVKYLQENPDRADELNSAFLVPGVPYEVLEEIEVALQAVARHRGQLANLIASELKKLKERVLELS